MKPISLIRSLVLSRKIFLFIVLSLVALATPMISQAQINAYAKVTKITGATLTLSNVNQTYHTYAVGEQLILVQMQDTVIGADTLDNVNYGIIGHISNVGVYEVGTISAVSITGSTGTITLTANPTYTYNTTVNADVQIVSFNKLSTGNYTSGSAVTAVAWNGSVGGIVAFQVGGTLTLGASVSADGLGFRGGALSANYEVTCEPNVYDTLSGNYGYKGEGIYATPTIGYTTQTGRGPLVSGGGGGSDDNGGGGGGGNYTAGGQGGPGWTCTTANASGGLGGVGLGSYIGGGRIFMGGGGGSGQQNNGVGSAGAAGGGIVIIKAAALTTSCTGTVSISAAGASAANSGNDGSGGAGAGGTIVLAVTTFSVSSGCPLTVAASGGNGGNVTDPNSHGGGGGGGQGAVIYSAALPTSNITTAVNNGAGGTNNAAGTTSAFPGSGVNNAGIIPGAPVVLPVSFLSFGAQKSGQEAVLNWITSKTYQHVTFAVQRSTDGLQYADLAVIDGVSDGGLTETYGYTDAAPLAGKNYYRIGETDLGGDVHYTSIAAVDWTLAAPIFRIYPNPAHGAFNVQLTDITDGPISVVIEDITGAVVHRQESVSAAGMVQVTPVQPLSAGIYLIRVATGKGVQTGKLLVR